MAKLKLEPSWKAQLASAFEQPYMKALRTFLQAEKAQGKAIYPKGADIFAAFDHTPFDDVRVVILGQDPYHGAGQAHGLCFSVQPGVEPPPSLKNIFKELQEDVDCSPVSHGCLTHWADQGVLLLNSVLTVEAAQAASHQGQGWERFTDDVIDLLNTKREHLVFMLWGSYAQKKGQFIDRSRHLVLTAPHPSPLSAYRGFLGCQHFSKANQYLKAHQLDEIAWQLPVTVDPTEKEKAFEG